MKKAFTRTRKNFVLQNLRGNGFSLIELIVVIAITAVLLAVTLPNFVSSRERARDTKRKEEMRQLKNALRLYYNDFQTYPVNSNCPKPSGGTYVNYVMGCGTTHAACCPCDTTVDFAVGANCSTIYMKKFPSSLGSDPISMMSYYSSGGDDFCLKVPLENAADGDIATSQSRCSAACGTNCVGTKDYCTCAD